MIELIQKGLFDNRNHIDESSGADIILDIIEEAGMLPPLVNQYPYLHKYGETYVNSQDLKWDEEDEAE